MKKYKVIFLGLMLSFAVLAEEPQLVTVTGDRVSLRAAPEINAVLLDRATIGDQLQLADNSNPKWVGVRPPQTLDFWVGADYVQDGVVLPARLNVRSGPSLSHGVVAVILRGEEVTVRGKLDGWVRVAPPEEAVVWISRAYVQFPEEEGAPIQEDEEPIVEPLEELRVIAEEVSELLQPDPDKEQAVDAEFRGVLQSEGSVLYKLIDTVQANPLVCYVRGNKEQLDGYIGQSLLMNGKIFWAKGLTRPLLVPEKIEVLSER